MAMKTPGVYIVEKNAFPNSVVEVATAVPAFIGYTESASNSGKSLLGSPWRISSMGEYVRYFGGPAKPSFTIAEKPAAPAGDPPKPKAAQGQLSEFTFGKKTYQLSRAAGKAGGRFLMYQAMKHFFQNGGGPCYVVSVGNYEQDIAAGDLTSALEPLLKEQEPTMVLVPDAVLLDEPGCISVQQAVLSHCGYRMRNRVAVLDVWAGDRDIKDPRGNCIEDFRNDIGINFLDFAAAYYPWLNTSLVQPGDIDYSVIANPADLVKLLKEDLGLPDAPPADDLKAKQRLDALADLALDDAGWATKLTTEIDASDKPAEEKDKAKAELADAERRSTPIAPHRQLLNKTVMVMSDLFAAVMDEARNQLNLMPPAAAMAGLYTMVDNTRGVWKAPANVSVGGVISPTVEISADDQQDLNVTTQGKSINAIRSFIGEGALVWGARTLDGNSLDWRYINVRRTMIMLEESCKLAAKAMVFEPNVANTWVTIKGMITNFLTGIWKRGGLAGAVPDDAFSVHVGLGETMTPEDILEGILRVTVLVAISRPAEFIEITFQQQMQKS
jgi:Bacteriophage tail sheath protein